MPRRRIIADTSVVVASLFEEVQTRRAQRLIDAIQRQKLTAFAPHTLIVEFIKAASMKTSRRDPVGESAIVDEQVHAFFDLCRGITLVRETEIQSEAWRLIRDESISPPDSWMLACAIHADAELWLTHDHSDGFVTAARSLHHSVFTLAQDAKHLP